MNRVSQIMSLVGGAVALGLGVAILAGAARGEGAIPLLTVGVAAAGFGIVAAAANSLQRRPGHDEGERKHDAR